VDYWGWFKLRICYCSKFFLYASIPIQLVQAEFYNCGVRAEASHHWDSCRFFLQFDGRGVVTPDKRIVHMDALLGEQAANYAQISQNRYSGKHESVGSFSATNDIAKTSRD